MSDYKYLIKSEAKKMSQLHNNIHVTYDNKNKDVDSWKKACEAFHSYVSKMDSFLNRVYEDKEYSDQDVLEFVISFLEVNPLFFRSGYIKEEMLRKLKRSPLVEKQSARLQVVLEHAVDNRGAREYKGYCRLASVIADDRLINALKAIGKSSEGGRKSRACLMLEYIKQ